MSAEQFAGCPENASPRVMIGGLAFWDVETWDGSSHDRNGTVRTIKKVRCGPIVDRSPGGSITVMVGTVYDIGCPPDERGMLLQLAAG